MLTNNGKKILEVLDNVGRREVEMSVENTCFGCTALRRDTYDQLERKYSPYCSLFDVWLDNNLDDLLGHTKEEMPAEIQPSDICHHHIRNKHKAF